MLLESAEAAAAVQEHFNQSLLLAEQRVRCLPYFELRLLSDLTSYLDSIVEMTKHGPNTKNISRFLNMGQIYGGLELNVIRR